jgi:hypothetical protein
MEFMNTFLADKSRMTDGDVIRIASDCLKQEIKIVSKIGRGANSKVYHVIGPSQEYAVKFYFQHPSDLRDRLGVEFKSFSFLSQQGLQMVPRPLALSRENNCAFYEFIKGTAPGPDISQKDIDRAVDFLEALKELSLKAKSLNFSPASEAFFSTGDIINSLRARLKRFNFEEAPEYLALREYLQNEFLPLLEAVEEWSKKKLTDHGIMWEKELLEQYRTLSPSDFGFHNAIRTSTGGIVFLDFEYFGWDDPAKLVSDFLWHPAMNMPEDLKVYFTRRMSTVFGQDPDFKVRLKSVFPLFGLKWCLIFLNEFVVSDAQRRNFARSPAENKTALMLGQLAKAKSLSERIKGMYKDFPYGY